MILVIDSSFKGYSALLASASDVIFNISSLDNRSSKLIFDLEKAFLEAKYKLQDLKTLIINIGPGSFTGIRTALTFAKTIDANLKLEIQAINSFEILRFLNPDLKQVAFQASANNPKELFVSLDEDYQNITTNFFTSDLMNVPILELPTIEKTTQIIYDVYKAKKIVKKPFEPYYLREPSLRLAKTHVKS